MKHNAYKKIAKTILEYTTIPYCCLLNITKRIQNRKPFLSTKCTFFIILQNHKSFVFWFLIIYLVLWTCTVFWAPSVGLVESRFLGESRCSDRTCLVISLWHVPTQLLECESRNHPRCWFYCSWKEKHKWKEYISCITILFCFGQHNIMWLIFKPATYMITKKTFCEKNPWI